MAVLMSFAMTDHIHTVFVMYVYEGVARYLWGGHTLVFADVCGGCAPEHVVCSMSAEADTDC